MTELSLQDLQSLMTTNSGDGQDVLSWTKEMLQAKSAMDQAIGTFHSVSDKEVALKASYKAMGLDPRDAPTFGWNMSERPRQSVTQVINNPTPPQPTASEQQPERPTPSDSSDGVVSSPSDVQVEANKPVLEEPARPGIPYWKSSLVGLASAAALYFGVNAINGRDTTPVQQDIQPAVPTQVQAAMPNTGLQSLICEELDSDPDLKAEIQASLKEIANKIKNHRTLRLEGGP